MSLRGRVIWLVEVLMRVPPLFVIDEILKIGLGLGYYEDLSDKDLHLFGDQAEKSEGILANATSYLMFDTRVSKYLLVSMMQVLIGALGQYQSPSCSLSTWVYLKLSFFILTVIINCLMKKVCFLYELCPKILYKDIK